MINSCGSLFWNIVRVWELGQGWSNKKREKIKTSKDEERDKQETEIKKKLQKNFEKEKESFRKRNVSENHMKLKCW